jgi:hypothetical protein
MPPTSTLYPAALFSTLVLLITSPADSRGIKERNPIGAIALLCQLALCGGSRKVPIWGEANKASSAGPTTVIGTAPPLRNCLWMSLVLAQLC